MKLFESGAPLELGKERATENDAEKDAARSKRPLKELFENANDRFVRFIAGAFNPNAFEAIVAITEVKYGDINAENSCCTLELGREARVEVNPAETTTALGSANGGSGCIEGTGNCGDGSCDSDSEAVFVAEAVELVLAVEVEFVTAAFVVLFPIAKGTVALRVIVEVEVRGTLVTALVVAVAVAVMVLVAANVMDDPALFVAVEVALPVPVAVEVDEVKVEKVDDLVRESVDVDVDVGNRVVVAPSQLP